MNTSNALKPLNTSAVLTKGLVVGEDGRVRPEWAAKDPLLKEYYDYEWGKPVHTESGLLERLSLEGIPIWSQLGNRVAQTRCFSHRIL